MGLIGGQMFINSSKIVVLKSSHIGTTGPKKGSIGYINRVLNTVLLEHVSVCATYCDVSFIRFGFEKKTRCENKMIIALFPIPDNKNSAKDQVSRLDSKINRKKKNKFLDLIRQYFMIGNKKATIVMAAPVYHKSTDLLKCSPNEFTAWLLSLAANKIFMDFITSLLITEKYTKSVVPIIKTGDLLKTLQNMYVDKQFRKLITSTWANNIDSRGEIVEGIRILETTHNRLSIILQNRGIKKRLSYYKKHKTNIESIFKLVPHQVFSPLTMPYFLNECRKIDNIFITGYADIIEDIITQYSILSTRVLDSGSMSKP